MHMGLFGKKQIKHYIVFDPYTEEVVAACSTNDVKQILQVQPKAKFVECSQFEMLNFMRSGIIPEDAVMRKRLEAKEVK